MPSLTSFFDMTSLLDMFLGCCINSSNISLNGRAYHIVKLLGEGGFSFVYLAQDGSGNLYALKKIRCTLGSEEAELAQREVEITQLFDHPNIIKLLDSSIITEPDETKTIYIVLPYYKRGNLQDAISKHNLNKTRFPEQEMIRIFRDVCKAVRAMHTYKAKGGAKVAYEVNRAISTEDDDHRQDVALLSQNSQHTTEQGQKVETGKKGDIIPWAHRDIKPGNVLLSDDGETPILMDFGSACPATIIVNSRQEALQQQDKAAEHSTMPYRAPELFDVKSGITLDEKVDIWSLGCTLYAMAYGQSPFDVDLNGGGSVSLAVLNNQYKFPQVDDPYSPELKEAIKWMLNSNPETRPDIFQVIDRMEEMLNMPATIDLAAS